MAKVKKSNDPSNTNKLINAKFAALDIKLGLFKDEIGDLVEEKLAGYRSEVAGFKDEVVGELQKLRDEVTVTQHLYKETNKRVDIVDKHLKIDTSVVFYR